MLQERESDQGDLPATFTVRGPAKNQPKQQEQQQRQRNNNNRQSTAAAAAARAVPERIQRTTQGQQQDQQQQKNQKQQPQKHPNNSQKQQNTGAAAAERAKHLLPDNIMTWAWNCQGSLGNRVGGLAAFIREKTTTNERPGIILLTEVGNAIAAAHGITVLNQLKYACISNLRDERRGGGVILAIDTKTFQYNEITGVNDDPALGPIEAVMAEIKRKDELSECAFTVASVYIPPQNNLNNVSPRAVASLEASPRKVQAGPHRRRLQCST